MSSSNLLIFLFFLIVALNDTVSAQLDRFSYSELDILPLNLEMAIGESEDFIPGQISTLIAYSNGTVLINEQQRAEITQFSPEGENLGAIARQGGGPGEILNTLYDLLKVGEDGLLINYQQGGRRDYFEQGADGTFEYRRSFINNEPNITVSIIGYRSEDSFFATRTPRRNAMNLITNYQPYESSDFVIVGEENNLLVDSGLKLKSSNRYIATTTRTDGSLASVNVTEPFPYRYVDHFVSLIGGGNRFLIASADSSAFYIYEIAEGDIEGQTESLSLNRKISLNVIQRPITEKDLDFHLEDVPRDYRETAESYMNEFKPPFMDVWTYENNILLHTDTTVEGKEMVLLTLDGEPLGKFFLSEIDDIQEVINDRIYTIHRDNISGHSVRVYSIEL